VSGRVVLIGGAGFIGRALTPALSAAGWEVRVIDRATADATDAVALGRAVVPADLVVHLAFPTDHATRARDPATTAAQVARAAHNVAAFARAASASHVILASSGKVYGAAAPVPVDEATAPAPTTFLGTLKCDDEARFAAAADTFGVTALRLFNIYGPGQRAGFLLPHLAAWFRATPDGPLVVGELDHARDFLHVTDAAQAFVLAAAVAPPRGSVRPLNVGSGAAVTARDLISLFSNETGRVPRLTVDPARARVGEAATECASLRRIAALGFAPRVTLREGIRTLLGETALPGPDRGVCGVIRKGVR